MEKKGKVNLTNEQVGKKFISNFDLVNYAIELAENMIKTGRDARVKSDTQNRAMLILEEIKEGKDQFDEIKVTTSAAHASESDLEVMPQTMVYEEQRMERRKYRTAEAYDREE